MAIKLPKNYWNNKFWAYMHDPFDKALDVKTHISRANQLVEIYTGLSQPNEEFWKKADAIASGFERGQITSYDKNEEKSGAVDFLKEPIITHPTGESSPLRINLPQKIEASAVWEDLKEFIKKEIGTKAGSGGYSDNFKGDEDKFSIARFLYTHLVLRFRLAEENVGGLGALWHRLPADTRFPDHSIWQHNALVSAIQSCFDIGGKDDLGMLVFSITPVQGFIAKARKLRDYWTGSILLSWLAFEGIKWVVENLGPDHILYPSLIDQYLVNEYLDKNWSVNKSYFLNNQATIASFPNKFLLLIPFSKSTEIANEIQKHILNEWNNIINLTQSQIAKVLNLDENKSEYIKELFNRQTKNFWEFQWASVSMLKKENEEEIKNLLNGKNYKSQFELLNSFIKMVEGKGFDESGIGTLYSVSHALCQSSLAATKAKKQILRQEEPGEKCHLCGEFEVLHTEKYDNNMSANEYNEKIKKFWNDFISSWNPDSDFKENEKLCSICTTKRIAYRVLKNEKKHILNSTFKQSENFPSTTYMALYNYYLRENIVDEDNKIECANRIHEKTDDTKVKDRYYAILMMDGDKMGDLVNGISMASTWQSIMHPSIYKKLNGGTIEEKYSKNWQNIFKNLPKRNLTPAIHAAISESLGDFAVYGVSSIIKNYGGRLIYAGGDDVCAVMPVSTALDAAEEISEYYKSYYKLIYKGSSNDIKVIDIENSFDIEIGKLSINLGKGEKISISAGILICHHKADLSFMIKEAHTLLDKKAKIDGGRDAVAIQLKKRSGGDRFFISKFNDERLQAFKYLSACMGEEMSRSLAYRLASFKDGIEAILNNKDIQEAERLEYLRTFIKSQLAKSGKSGISHDDMSENITKVVLDNKGCFTNEALIIAGFLKQYKEVKGE
ncbi:type III-B CRISPR-associated protein Cas10/Cmr2 [Deferribacterales bacterium Es71-Z0220]|uniref:type III-B CRISPR-associated protein Cas10/Cmr2 n=1 Tax=Deferrivibrio essentukiensis TaxID=2880922 RepID=UPI001F61A597|nr:type III-B CRISPR-associated protein Cas10/Cmr2 [Deferrivibrio essentukiensis]MCB4205239.1 type III-B CRISPR-associated protein Cas10/Cmr2 [Deferrivibrio essentukiensis]